MDTEHDVFTVGDAARDCACSGATIRRIADELRLPVARTRGGVRLITAEQVERVKVELARRTREVGR